MIDGSTDWLQTAVASVGGAVLTFFGLRRKYSSDSKAIASDKAEEKIITTLIAERDVSAANAREAWAQRANDAQEIGRLQGQNMMQEREIQRLRDDLFNVHLKLRQLSAIVMKLDPETAKMLGISIEEISRPFTGDILKDT